MWLSGYNWGCNPGRSNDASLLGRPRFLFTGVEFEVASLPGLATRLLKSKVSLSLVDRELDD